MRAAVAAAAVSAVLAGCSFTEGRGIDYKSAGRAPALDIPPDLTRPGRDDRYAVPDTLPASGSATLSGVQANRTAATPATTTTGVLPKVSRGRIERLASGERVLILDEPAEKLWSEVREFWQSNGFILSTDRPEVGVMETDWAENRARIPGDGIRSVLGRLLDTAYSTGERDRFRTRMERTVDGKGTELFISHRGMVERVVNSTRGMEGTIWEPRDTNRELEAEFLQRLLVRLGNVPEVAREQVATAPVAPERAQIKPLANVEQLVLTEPFDRAWRRVGLALDRVGFTVEDRDRSKGLYFVRYVDPKDDIMAQKPGFFARIFGVGMEERALSAAQYRVRVNRSGTESSEVEVLDKEGAVDRTPVGKRILALLHQQLR